MALALASSPLRVLPQPNVNVPSHGMRSPESVFEYSIDDGPDDLVSVLWRIRDFAISVKSGQEDKLSNRFGGSEIFDEILLSSIAVQVICIPKPRDKTTESCISNVLFPGADENGWKKYSGVAQGGRGVPRVILANWMYICSGYIDVVFSSRERCILKFCTATLLKRSDSRGWNSVEVVSMVGASLNKAPNPTDKTLESKAIEQSDTSK